MADRLINMVKRSIKIRPNNLETMGHTESVSCSEFLTN